MKVSQLIKILKKLPQDSEVKFHEKGSVYDIPILAAYIDQWEMKQGRNIVMITGRN